MDRFEVGIWNIRYLRFGTVVNGNATTSPYRTPNGFHSYFSGIDDLVQTKCTIVTALLRAFHPCIAHPRAISSTPGSRSDVYKCTNSREWTQASD